MVEANPSEMSCPSGRPGFMHLLRVQEDWLKQVRIEMARLSKDSIVNGTSIRVRVEKRHDGVFHLRWYAFGRNRSWQELEPEVSQLAAPVRRHFDGVNRRVGELNVLALMYQQAVKRLEMHLGKRKATKRDAEH